MLTSTDRVLRARLGAYALHAQRDGRETTAAARIAFLARFESQVDPDGVLDPDERRRRAEFARRAHFARMAIRSAQARRKAKRPSGQARASQSAPCCATTPSR